MYVIILGVFLQFYMFGNEIFHVIILTYVSYALMGLAPRDKQQHIVTVFVFSYLTYNNYLDII